MFAVFRDEKITLLICCFDGFSQWGTWTELLHEEERRLISCLKIAKIENMSRKILKFIFKI